MSIVVQKYGGSSVADVDKLRAVAAKVAEARRAGDDVVVVVSAMGKTTDQLLALAKQVDESPPRRELDMLLTTGERVSMALLSMAVQKLGFDAISFTGSQSGIITNDRHFDARIIEVRPHRIEDELSRGRVVIVAGYQGMSYKREITTLGRGGSDTTALALAAALGATRAEIYSDVDGVYTADPRVVPDARHLPEIGFEQMQEMATAGAKVLHAEAVEFARRAKIAIHARATFKPGRETVVHDAATAARGVCAVVGQRGITRVRVEHGIRSVLSAAEAQGVLVHGLECDSDAGVFHVLALENPDWEKARATLLRGGEGVVRFATGLATVSVIAAGGESLRPAALLDAISSAGIAPAGLSAGSVRMCVWLADPDADRAVQVLHGALVA